MYWAKISNGVVEKYPIVSIREELQNVSLPIDMTLDSNLPDGYFFVNDGLIPSYDSMTQKVVKSGIPTLRNDGRYEDCYVVLDMTQEEIDAYKKSVVPQSISMRQARLALLQSGLLTTVTNAITNGTDDAMKIEWEYATEVRRDWSSLVDTATALGMSSEQLDDLFVLAGTL